MIDFNIFAAKSNSFDSSKWLSFKVHSLDTAGITVLLFRRWLPQSVRELISQCICNESDYERRETKAENFCILLALLHDIGKLTPAFQYKISKSIENYKEHLYNNEIDISHLSLINCANSPHNAAGQNILNYFEFPDEISTIIGSHHGRPASYENQIEDFEYRENYFGYKCSEKAKWESVWKEYISYVVVTTGFNDIKNLPVPDVKLQFILTGLLIMSDWIASNQNYFPCLDTDVSLTYEEQKNRIIQGYKKLDLPNSLSAENAYDILSLFIERFKFKPNNVQVQIMETVLNLSEPGIVILEASMGIGKTEAALAAAEIFSGKFGEGGIYFGLPTQATANGIFSRINSWAKTFNTNEKHTIRLAHGMIDLNEEYRSLFHGKASDSGDECLIVHEWFEGRKQALLSDFVVATVDQFLMASLKQKHVMLRHLGLSGKVVIIDECHAYDAYMNVYLDRTLMWMGAYGVPVIILSATLPSERRKKLVNAYLKGRYKSKSNFPNEKNNLYPRLTYTSGNEIITKSIDTDSDKKIVKITNVSEIDLADVISTKLCGGGCAAIIVNTVDYAQKIYDFLSDELSEFNVVCFHSRFAATDRAETETMLLLKAGKKSSENDRNKLVVVATQVLEQSLDLDFDFMVTELCPMDLLLQRSGRLHRHNRTRPKELKSPELALLTSADEKDSTIYSKWILKRTKRFLPDKLEIPDCIPVLVDSVYSPPGDDEVDEDYKKYIEKISDKEYGAKKYCIEFKQSKYSKTISGFLDDDVGNESMAKAAVRDSDESIEAIILQKSDDGKYKFLPWHNGGAELDTNYALSDDECIAVAKERVTLPPIFALKDCYNKTIEALCEIPVRWRESALLNGELILLLDENFKAEICSKIIIYSREKGLYYINKEGE